jgi:hypothetical protein
MVGGVDLGGMALETNVRVVQSQSEGFIHSRLGGRGRGRGRGRGKREAESLPPSVTTCGGDQ